MDFRAERLRANVVNHLLVMGSRADSEGYHAEAADIYEAAVVVSPQNTEGIRFLYGALQNLRHQKIREEADEKEIRGIEERLAEIEIDYAHCSTGNFASRKLFPKYMEFADENKKEGNIGTAAMFYFVAMTADPSIKKAARELCSCLVMIREHRIDQGAPNDEIEEIDKIILFYGLHHLEQH